MQRSLNSIFFSTLPLATIGYLLPLSVQAQITPDGTTSTTVNQNGDNFLIEQGDRVGDNLFHSFNEFSVPTLGSAVFNNAGDIANIFSRVTGSSISSIDGLLGANGTANLYLINPNGIIFGENASLQLGGSFFASTADSLLFEGDAEFSAVNPQATPLLEVNIPIGLSFRDNPGDITVNGLSKSDEFSDFNPEDIFKEFDPEDIFKGFDPEDISRGFDPEDISRGFDPEDISRGFDPEDISRGFGRREFSDRINKNIKLIGGNINVNSANIFAPGGTIFIGGLNQAGIVRINEDLSLSFPENALLSNVSLANNTVVDITAEGGGGNIIFNASDIKISDRSMLITNALEEGKGGTINITANNLFLSNSSSINTGIIENNRLEGNSGDILINVSDTISLEASIIQSGVSKTEQEGKINISAADLILTENSSINTGVRSQNTIGNIFIEGGDISSLKENASNIFIDIADTIYLKNSTIQSRKSFTNDIGVVDIKTSDLILTENSSINTDLLFQGDGSNILINAKIPLD